MLVVAVTALIGALLTLRGHDSNNTALAVDHHKATTTTSTTTPPTTTSTIPTAVTPVAPGHLAGEGVWVPAGRRVNGKPAIFTTILRPPAGGLPVGVARIDTTLTKVVLVAGTSQPGGVWSAEAAVPAAQEPTLVAAFNGGFQFATSGGGFYADGRAQPALRLNAASLVVHRDGTAEVDAWGRDATLTPDIAEVRQNLSLLVDGGAPAPTASEWGAWGATLSHTAATWRSAVGSDDHHNLFFVGGPGLTPRDLATVLVTVGAQRAMEFDINPQWVFFSSYADGLPGQPLTVGTKLLPSMNYTPGHVLVSNWRDFVAVYTKP